MADMQVHDAHEVVAAVAATVKPGDGFRFVEDARKSSSALRNGGVARPRRRPLTDEEKGRLAVRGQRAVALRALTMSIAAGRVAVDPPKLTKAHWARRVLDDAGVPVPILVRWQGQPYGVYADGEVAWGRLAAIAADHHADERGLCVECGRPWQCRTYMLAGDPEET